MRVFKRYVPTGGELVVRLLRRWTGGPVWMSGTRASALFFERVTRGFEAIHLLLFVLFTVPTALALADGRAGRAALAAAMAVYLAFTVHPVMLQRYNRIRIYRVLGLSGRRVATAAPLK